jgi:hypothetical protein
MSFIGLSAIVAEFEKDRVSDIRFTNFGEKYCDFGGITKDGYLCAAKAAYCDNDAERLKSLNLASEYGAFLDADKTLNTGVYLRMAARKCTKIGLAKKFYDQYLILNGFDENGIIEVVGFYEKHGFEWSTEQINLFIDLVNEEYPDNKTNIAVICKLFNYTLSMIDFDCDGIYRH